MPYLIYNLYIQIEKHLIELLLCVLFIATVKLLERRKLFPLYPSSPLSSLHLYPFLSAPLSFLPISLFRVLSQEQLPVLENQALCYWGRVNTHFPRD